MLISFFFIGLSCQKELPSFAHSDIDFSFADSIAGTYMGNLHTESGPPLMLVNDTIINIEVIDARTSKECKFYVDYFNSYIYVSKDLSFYSTFYYYSVDAYLTESKFDSSYLYVTEDYYNKYVTFDPFTFVGEKQ